MMLLFFKDFQGIYHILIDGFVVVLLNAMFGFGIM
jgi:hypothetical protein